MCLSTTLTTFIENGKPSIEAVAFATVVHRLRWSSPCTSRHVSPSLVVAIIFTPSFRNRSHGCSTSLSLSRFTSFGHLVPGACLTDDPPCVPNCFLLQSCGLGKLKSSMKLGKCVCALTTVATCNNVALIAHPLMSSSRGRQDVPPATVGSPHFPSHAGLSKSCFLAG